MAEVFDNCVLKVENLKITLNDTEIIRGIDLNVNKGEFVGIIGPNGAGKTTLLKSLNGIYRGSGDIFINGAHIRNMGTREIARNVSLMHQNTEITFPFTALEVVMTGRYPYLKGIRGETARDYAIARRYMEYTGISKLEDKPVTQMSGGERQRVLFAKTLAQEAGIILLDEPASNLDIAYAEQIFRLSESLCREGKTVIAAVHDLKIAARYCTRLVLMKDGLVVADGAPSEVITADNLSRAYNVRAIVYKNRITGELDYYLQQPMKKNGTYKVHVIGGGGSASGIIRFLADRGCEISGGVFPHGDSDLNCAEIFGAETVSCKPFMEIDDESYSRNVALIREASMTILCNMPFGRLNIRNLEAAAHATRLVIIEDDRPETRDYTNGEALKLYNTLKGNAITITSAQLHEIL